MRVKRKKHTLRRGSEEAEEDEEVTGFSTPTIRSPTHIQ